MALFGGSSPAASPGSAAPDAGPPGPVLHANEGPQGPVNDAPAAGHPEHSAAQDLHAEAAQLLLSCALSPDQVPETWAVHAHRQPEPPAPTEDPVSCEKGPDWLRQPDGAACAAAAAAAAGNRSAQPATSAADAQQGPGADAATAATAARVAELAALEAFLGSLPGAGFATAGGRPVSVNRAGLQRAAALLAGPSDVGAADGKVEEVLQTPALQVLLGSMPRGSVHFVEL